MGKLLVNRATNALFFCVMLLLEDASESASSVTASAERDFLFPTSLAKNIESKDKDVAIVWAGPSNGATNCEATKNVTPGSSSLNSTPETVSIDLEGSRARGVKSETIPGHRTRKSLGDSSVIDRKYKIEESDAAPTNFCTGICPVGCLCMCGKNPCTCCSLSCCPGAL